MAYTKTTDFAAKDVLVTGDPNKIIRGTEINAEFDAIQTADALNAKATDYADSSGSSLVGFIQSGSGAEAVTVQYKLRQIVSIADFGGATSASEATNDAAFAAAFAVSNHVIVPSSASYYSISTPIAIPANGVLDVRGARIVSSDPRIITFGGDGALLGEGAFLRTSSTTAGSAIALASPMPANAAPKIYGFPQISIDDATIDPSVGIDMTGWYGGYVEARVMYFKNGILLANTATQPCYYNTLQKPWIRCGTATGASGIKILKATGSTVNATTIVSPYVTGANSARYGIHMDGAGAVSVLGGYLEAFAAADTATRGIYIKDCDTISISGVTLDSASSVANYAIGINGTCTGLYFDGIAPASGWAANTKMLDNPDANTFTMIGEALYDRTLIGRTDTTMPTASGTYQGANYVGATRAADTVFFDVAGKGVDYSVTSAAGGGAGSIVNSLLDYYEEGTWTPTDGSGAGLSLTASGTYTKIGNLVFAYASVTFPVTANTSNIRIDGLPYTVDVVGGAGVNYGGYPMYNTSTRSVTFGCLSASSAVSFYNPATAATNWKNNEFSNSTVRFMVIYKHV